MGRPSTSAKASLGNVPPRLGKQRRLLSAGALERGECPRDPGIIGRQARRRVARLDLDLDHRQAARVEMAAQVIGELRPVGADDKTQLAMGESPRAGSR